jgi:hypothetical protein
MAEVAVKLAVARHEEQVAEVCRLKHDVHRVAGLPQSRTAPYCSPTATLK